MRFQRIVGTVQKLFGQRARRIWIGKSRAHIEFRELDRAELEAFFKQVIVAYKSLSRVRPTHERRARADSSLRTVKNAPATLIYWLFRSAKRSVALMSS